MKAFLKKKISDKKGFTLAELLVVVAIIAILVAISIPIFTSQLEKSREATDKANIRSAYAAVSARVLDGDTSESGTDENGVSANNGTYTATVKATQTRAGWQNGDTNSDGTINIGGKKVKAKVKASGKAGEWTITGKAVESTTTKDGTTTGNADDGSITIE